MAHAAAAALVLAILLAGCSDAPAQDPGPTESPTPAPTEDEAPAIANSTQEPVAASPSPAPLTLDFSADGCDGRYDYLAVDLDWASAQLPSGYAPKQFFPAARAALSFVTVNCPGFRQGDLTLPGDQVTLVSIWTGGSFPAEDHYLLRAYHKDGNGTLAQVMAGQGIEVVTATVELTDWGGPMTIHAPDHSVAMQSTGETPTGLTEFGFRYDLERPGLLPLQWALSIPGVDDMSGSGYTVASTDGGPYLGACPAGLAAAEPPMGACQCETVGLRGFRLTSSMA